MAIVGALSFILMNRWLGHGDDHHDHHDMEPLSPGGTHMQLHEMDGLTPRGNDATTIHAGLEAPQSPTGGYKVVDTKVFSFFLPHECVLSSRPTGPSGAGDNAEPRGCGRA